MKLFFQWFVVYYVVMIDHDDSKLLEAFFQGEKSAFGSIIEKYHVQVYRLAYKFTRDKKDAEDVAQDTFLRAYENLMKHPKEDLNLKPWLMTICVNLCRNLAKKKKSFAFSELEFEDDDRTFEEGIKDKEPTPRKRALENEKVKAVESAVGRLDDKYQVVIRLRYIEDLAYNEIAEVLNIPINTVKIHLNRAKKQLKTYLAPYGQ